MTNREKAIDWWNNLDFEEQFRLKNEHIGSWFPMSMITGFSIEMIYETIYKNDSI